MPEAAEWFCERLRCGVLEPTPEPSLPGEERAIEAIDPAPIGLEDAMVPAAEHATGDAEAAGVGHSHAGTGKTFMPVGDWEGRIGKPDEV